MKMRSLQNMLFILCTALSCVTGTESLIHVFGYEGREARVSCPYGEGYLSHEKYLCKNDCGNEDVLITTTEGKKSRYSIHDDTQRRVFTATISHLSHTDAGTYWCGVTRTVNDIYTEVKLDVRQDTCCDQSTKVQSYETASVSLSCPYEPADQDSLKYICRGNKPSTCLQQAAITSETQQNGRFRLTDDKSSRKFTVTITSLTQEDSGSYLCGVQRNSGLDVFTAVELEVKGWCCVKSKHMSGIAGRPVTMQCPYPPQHRNSRKFLCKGDNRNNCVDMVTSQSRFTLQDDVSLGSFTVTITELQTGDAGTYWCGSDSQWSPADYTKIQLSVDAAPTHVLVYILPAAVAALVLLTVALVMVYKFKCDKVQGGEVCRELAEAGEVKSVEHVREKTEQTTYLPEMKQLDQMSGLSADLYQTAPKEFMIIKAFSSFLKAAEQLEPEDDVYSSRGSLQ